MQMAGEIGQGICQCTDLSQSPSSGCGKDPECEAGVGRGFGEDWMRRLAKQAVEHQGQGVGEGVGRRSS